MIIAIDRGEERMKFWKTLKNHKNDLTEQEYRTIAGQLKKGDVAGAKKGLQTCLNRIPEDSRREAHESVDKETRYKQIIETLGNSELSAKEIAVRMRKRGMIPTDERNFTAPRLTELAKKGVVVIAGKKKCKYSGRTVAVYAITPNCKNQGHIKIEGLV